MLMNHAVSIKLLPRTCGHRTTNGKKNEKEPRLYEVELEYLYLKSFNPTDTSFYCVWKKRNRVTIGPRFVSTTTLLPESFLPMAGTGTLSSKQKERNLQHIVMNITVKSTEASTHSHTHKTNKQ